MQNRRLQSIECDSCFITNDTISEHDPNEYLDLGVDLKPEYRRQLMYFWLCPDCKPEFPNGPKDFFSEDFFEAEPFCERCEVEPVENWGHVCDYCEDGEI